jgi:hypothetical protein
MIAPFDELRAQFGRLRAQFGRLRVPVRRLLVQIAGLNVDELRLTFLRYTDPARSCPLGRVREHCERVDDH